MKNRLSFLYIFSGVILTGGSAFAAETPGYIFQNAWANVCSNAGSDLTARCTENNLDGTSQSLGNGGVAAGTGNNGGIISGVGNSTIISDQYNKKSIDERRKKLKQQGAAGDVFSAEKLGFFTSGLNTEIDRKNTTLETGYNSDILGFTVGMDYIFSEKLVSGIAVSYSDTNLNYNSNAGNSDYESVSVLSYANYNVNNHLSMNGYVGWTGIDLKLGRNISYAAASGGGIAVNTASSADANENKVLAGLSFDYAQYYNALTLTPRLKLDYSGTYIDSYTESGGRGFALKYQSQDIQSFKSNLGLDASYAVSIPWGVVLPRIQAGYVHEFLDHRRTIHASFVQDPGNFDLQFETDSPDRDYFVIGGGVSAVLAHSMQLFVNYERVEGNRYINSYTVSGGVRIGF